MQELMVRIKNRVVGAVLCAAIVFFIFRHCAFIGVSTLGVLSSSLVYPFLRVQHFFIEPFKDWLTRSATIQELERACILLKKEKDELTAENVSLKGTYYYAQETTDLRNFNQRYLLQKGRIVSVLARHFSPNNQFFLMDAGSRNGIEKDMVALYCNCIIGRVCEVYPWYCKVCLITDAECKVAAMCQQTGASGIHEGINDSYHTGLRYVSHLEKIELNSMVLSRGEGFIFPRGFALGRIKTVVKGDLFYLIDVQPMVDFNSLSYCILIAKDEIGAMALP
jgi:rod shape-determining protein MreC